MELALLMGILKLMGRSWANAHGQFHGQSMLGAHGRSMGVPWA